MEKYNFNNKKFVLVENSENGQVNTETIFEYQQQVNLVTANYKGGSITYGKIIAILDNDRLDMLYQCVTTENELKAGKAIAKISKNENGKIILDLDWEWLNVANAEKGKSRYIEV